ncbi:hypothetical protein GUITHDRAFT_152893 [Guillardia theta CCMP2712]|uniref:Uncharacterized protein n=1 Tax=Guillardia theta (strain CCMP2712) TaxID=905079 RepID=L1J8R4_GUITC|nr:hypothetical protein GUITHDRAFT_152893 [Guillardia theta CCMP2712]EKX44906.1 hypothetical protein GUITHDRAFT_152893 [Guillardia theta CCMP2712]|eukprot:XP_005831886.1 hypothetical protein GUITHDRAFT_152893 [Guillardia theta CCMP2712]
MLEELLGLAINSEGRWRARFFALCDSCQGSPDFFCQLLCVWVVFIGLQRRESSSTTTTTFSFSSFSSSSSSS